VTDELPYRPSALEVASGLIFGFAPPKPVPASEPPRAPLTALEDAIRPALLRGPCLVSFCGSRESVAILAVAVALARREGLEPPVPATFRFPTEAGRTAAERQERIVVSLGLTDWLRFEFDQHLDLVGPVAMRSLRRHGLMSPFDAYWHLPLIDEALGGSLITGRTGSVPSLRPLRWLRREARLEVTAQIVALATTAPHGCDRVAWLRGLRSVRVELESLALLAERSRVQLVHPLLEHGFGRALQASGAPMSELLECLLPVGFVDGPADLRFACWTEASRAVAVSWDDDEVDRRLVDVDALRREWSKEAPDERTFLLLQSVAAAREGRSVVRQLAEAVGGLV
jgi:asparagine synthase (glutamine-hydrolysing)